MTFRDGLPQSSLAACIGISPQGLGHILLDKQIKTERRGRVNLIAPEDAYKILEIRGFKKKPLCISVQMLKGGSGKTSTLFNILIRAKQYGYKCLAIDLDMQANLTHALGVDGNEHEPFVRYAQRKNTLESLIIEVEPGISLIPSNYNNSTIDLELFTNRADIHGLLKRPLDKLRTTYDLILIDCNPSLSTLNTSASLASDVVLIPVNPDNFSSLGVEKTIKDIEAIQQDQKPQISLVYTMIKPHENTTRLFLAEYTTRYDDILLSSFITRCADVQSGTVSQRSVFELSKASHIQAEFDSLTREILGISKFFSKHHKKRAKNGQQREEEKPLPTRSDASIHQKTKRNAQSIARENTKRQPRSDAAASN